jgi:hypothetical protein
MAFMGNVCCLLFVVCCLLFPLRGFKIYDLVFLIEDNVVYRIHTFIHFGCAREPGKTRGAIGFAAVAGVPKGHLRHFKIKKAGY